MEKRMSNYAGECVKSPVKAADSGLYPIHSLYPATQVNKKDDLDILAKMVEEKEKMLDNFVGKEYKKTLRYLTISPSSSRVMCYNLNIESIDKMKEAMEDFPTLIGFLLSSNIEKYMSSLGYTLEGKSNFSGDGEFLVPCRETIWDTGKEDISLLTEGYLFFLNRDNGEKCFFRIGADRCAFISFITDSSERSNFLLRGLVEYTKGNNCLRGAKIKDANIFKGSFEKFICDKENNWDNFCYDNEIKELIELELFGYLNNIEEYNSMGIHRRGILVHGCPGSGKSSLGKILCNYSDHTVLWITLDSIKENESQIDSIKMLYKLFEFLAPGIIIIEDIDLIAEDRESVRNNMKLGSLMNVLDGVGSIKNCITIATTNKLSTIEDAIKNRPGRFDRIVEISSLSNKLLEKLFKNRFSRNEHKISYDQDIIDYIVQKSNGWTGAVAEEFVKTLNLIYRKENISNKILTKEYANKAINIMERFGMKKKKQNKIGFVNNEEE